MGALGNAVLGLTFWAVGFANTLLMFKLWGYPFDHERMVSAAPRLLMLLHRALGYLFLGIYLYLMWQMVPRMWQYQVELPARTVLHLTMGIAIGIVLLVKILIVRFFKHLESTTVPFLGILLLVCTTVLIGLSVPFALREAYVSSVQVAGAGPGTPALARVRELLPRAGLPKEIPVETLATTVGLSQGRGVLLRKCVTCHDLRTVLAKPRTPEDWVETVRRMAERAVFEPISEVEQWHVAAYLVAISPDLQKAVSQKRQMDSQAVPSALIRKPPPHPRVAPAPPAAFDLAKAKGVFESTCNGCHSLSNVENSPPKSEADARALVARMVDNSLSRDEQTLEQIVGYLARTYGK
jgi:mono/diheme cytochrome c family protein